MSIKYKVIFAGCVISFYAFWTALVVGLLVFDNRGSGFIDSFALMIILTVGSVVVLPDVLTWLCRKSLKEVQREGDAG